MPPSGSRSVHTKAKQPELDAMLARIQNDLFDLGADLCFPDETKDARGRLNVTDAQVARLEDEIDKLNRDLKPLRSFVLPGGSPAVELPASGAHHLAPRRAADGGARLARERGRGGIALYQSGVGFLFVASRYANDKGETDVLWVKGQNR